MASISWVTAISRFSGRASSHSSLTGGDVGVRDVTAVLAQVGGDAVGAGGQRLARRAHRIGIHAAARVPHGGDVVDVDAQSQSIGPEQVRSPRASPYFASRRLPGS
jgi:hypothetical protein